MGWAVVLRVRIGEPRMARIARMGASGASFVRFVGFVVKCFSRDSEMTGFLAGGILVVWIRFLPFMMPECFARWSR